MRQEIRTAPDANLPLIRNFGVSGVFAYQQHTPIGTARFLSDVREVAARLPAAAHVVNLCVDRYHFAVGFGAALLRGQVSLLPPNQTVDLFTRLGRSYPDAYCLVDSRVACAPFDAFAFPELKNTHAPVLGIPAVPASQIAAIVLTSGSTGEPTPHLKSWGALVRSVSAEFARLGVKDGCNTAIVGTVPPQHMYGLESTVLLPMQGGLALHSGRPFYPADISGELEALPRPRSARYDARPSAHAHR